MTLCLFEIEEYRMTFSRATQ